VAQQPNSSIGCPILEVSRSDTFRHMHPVGLLRMRDQLVTEDMPTQHITNTRDENPCPQWDLNL